MHELRSSIHARLPWLCFTTRALLDAVLLNGGSIGSAGDVSSRLGLLRAHGLPPLHRQSAWMTVLSWVWNWDRTGAPLSDSALRAGMDPAAGYRLVVRVTGRSWSAVRAAGAQWALSTFLGECGG